MSPATIKVTRVQQPQNSQNPEINEQFKTLEEALER